ncbi:hypothetical protein HU200_046900 [Digitaria exilis]|uniref:Protein THYLAKOID RHODANESE-LIKE, chloroplastic n=1 Tax=Digitaria exilis TaxID=1010633 RepID=A0A835AV89_9POAL|nr:hypothetical protein HU200_046900 [Digitaria exilis]
MAVILSSAAPTPLTAPARPPRRRPPSAARGGLARLSGGVALGLSLSHAGAGAALAAPLSYEEMLRLSTDSDSDLGGFALPDLGLDGLADFVSENPLVVAAGVAAVALPLLLAQLLGGGGGSKPYSVVSARAAYQRLLEEPAAQLVDIRTRKDAQEDGAPDLREAKKKVVAVPYSGEDKNGFLKKLALRLKDPENTILIILDKFDGNSELVAELVTATGYKAAFAVKDGAEGSRGWKSSNLPWKEPAKGFSFNELFGDGSDSLPLTIGVAAATGLGVLAYTEIETLLQFLGSAAIVQLFATKLLYAEDRQKTLKQIDEFFNKKVAPKDLVDEIKEIGQALLPLPGEAKSQPALASATPAAATATAAPTEAGPAEATPLSPYTTYPDLKPPSPPSSTSAEGESESTTTEAPAVVNSAPVGEASTESPPARPRPQSPYPNYPDFKPPSSPTPSPP